MPIQGRRESSGGKRNAYLLLSLILLVWNICASAYRVASVHFFPPVEYPVLSPPPGYPLENGTGSLPAESPRSGPLTIQQKYLLNKRVDINKASLLEISELPGISRSVAVAVVAERDRLGRFRSHADLLSVKGIKRKRLQKILPFLAEMKNN